MNCNIYAEHKTQLRVQQAILPSTLQEKILSQHEVSCCTWRFDSEQLASEVQQLAWGKSSLLSFGGLQKSQQSMSIDEEPNNTIIQTKSLRRCTT